MPKDLQLVATQIMEDAKNYLREFFDNLPPFSELCNNSSIMDAILNNPLTQTIGFVGSLGKAIDIKNELHLLLLVWGLRGCNKNGENKENHYIQKLYEYTSNSKNTEYVIEMMRTAFATNSKKVCTIIGLYLSELPQKGKNISQKDIIILDTLKTFNDFDVTNYIHALEPIAAEEENCEDDSYERILGNDFNTETDVTLHKCVATGMILKNLTEPPLDGRLAMGGNYKAWRESIRFYNLCKKVEDTTAEYLN